MMTRFILITSLLLMLTHVLISQDSTHKHNHHIETFTFTQVEKVSVDNLSKRASSVIEIPVTQSKVQTYRVSDKSTSSNRLSKKFPESRNYVLNSTTDNSNGYMHVSPIGVFITLYKDGLVTAITPLDINSGKYQREIGSSDQWQCGNAELQGQLDEFNANESSHRANLIQHGEGLYIYRLVLAITSEYYIANGNDFTAVNAWINFAVNGVSAIFRNNLSVEFDLVDATLYTNPSTDPFTPDQAGGASRPSQAQSVIEDLYSLNEYDIGHVFHNTSESINGGISGWSGGGVAGLGVVCRDTRKASGWSGSFNNQSTGFISLTTHEFGHMFDAEHTFNGIGDNCTSAISETSAYEIASGTTIMSYNGLCQSDNNIPGAGVMDDYFHVRSLNQMIDYIRGSGNCIQPTNLNNSIPTSDANPNNEQYVIPVRTPFFITGVGTDDDESDELTYCWEQYNEDGAGTPTQGKFGIAAANDARAPLWRSFPPTSSPTRYIPRLSNVLNNIDDDFEVLTRRSRETTLRLTVRDNNGDHGAIAIDEVDVSFSSNGPLLIFPFGVPNMEAGQPFEIEWRVNGTEDFCDNVDILLSIDGGLTFDFVLAEGIPYADTDGSTNETFSTTLPAGLPATDEARIMVKCVDSDYLQFYDVNTNNETISSSCIGTGSSICDVEPLSVESGDPLLDLDETFSLGQLSNTVNGVIDSNDPSGPVIRLDPSGNCDVFTNRTRDEFDFQVSESGSYTFFYSNAAAPNFSSRYVSYHTVDNFDVNNPCTSLIATNASEGSSSNSTSFGNPTTLNLEKCVEYKILSFSFSSSNTLEYEVSGPGNIISPSNTNADYAYTFIAINQTSNTILGVSDLADFTTLPGGDYLVYGVNYKASGVEPPLNQTPSDWIGRSLNDVLSAGGCLLLSSNSKPLSIEGGCSIFDVQVSDMETCTDEETFNISLDISYANHPVDGTLVVNGQTFPITTSPQTVTIVSPSDGSTIPLSVTIAEDPTCDFLQDLEVTAPALNPIIDEVNTLPPTGCETADGSIEVTTVNSGNFTYTLSAPASPDITNDTGIFNNLPPGFYQVSVQSTQDCSIDYDQNPISLIGDNTLTALIDPNVIDYCTDQIEPIIVESNTGVDFEWSSISATTTILSNTNSYLPTESGTYQVIVRDDTGCSQTAIAEVNIIENPETGLQVDTAICQFDELLLDATAIVTANYTWQFEQQTIEDSNSNGINISEAGQYTLEVTDQGCKSFDTFNLSLIAVPIFELGDDLAACVGEEISLDVSDDIFITNPQFSWTAPDNTEIGTSADITLTGSNGTGSYSLVVNDVDTGCNYSDQVTIDYVETPTINIPEDEVRFCQDENVTIISESNFTNIIWTLNGDTLIDVSDAFVTLDTPGEVIAQVGINTCIARDTVDVVLSELPVVLLGADRSGCEGDQIILDASNETSTFNWYINDINVELEGDDEYIANVSGVYVAETRNDDQCINTDTVIVTLEPTWPIDIGQDTIVCDSDNLRLPATTQAPNQSWYYNPTQLPDLPNGFVSGQDTLICQPGDTGFYIAETQRGDCFARDTIEVTKNPSPELDLPLVEFICGVGNSVTVAPDDIVEGIDYAWYLDQDLIVQGEEATFDADGFYTLVATDAIGCTSSSMIGINTVPTEYSLQFSSGTTVIQPDVDTIRVCGGQALSITATSDDPTELAIFSWYTDLLETPVSTSPSFTINNNSDARYYVEYTHFNSGCQIIDSFFVEYSIPPIVELDNMVACEGQDIIIDTGLEGFNHTWFFGNTVLESSNQSQISVSEAGEYFVSIYETNEDCAITESFQVTTTPSPQVVPLSDGLICSGQSIDLVVQADSEDYDYQWFQGPNTIIGATEDNITVQEGGLYTVIITSNGNCADTLMSNVIESLIDPLELGDDIPLCPGETITVAPIDGQFANYQWSTTEVTEEITITATEVEEITTTNITLVVDNGEGCILSDEINIINFPIIDAEIISDVEGLCATDSIELVATGGLYYNWTLGSESLSADDVGAVIANPQETTIYVVEVTDDCPQNGDTDTLTLNVFPLSDFSAGVDTCAFEDLPFNLEAMGGIDYQWDNTNLISGASNIANPVIRIDEETTFTVTITDEFGCMFVDEVDVCLRANAEDLVDIVTIITPNGDGKNDELYFEGLELYPTNKLTIFNRWGNIIYSQLDYQRGGDTLFDGTNGIDELPSDTYYYILEFNGLFIKEALTITRD